MIPPGIDFLARSHCARDFGVTRVYSSDSDSIDLTIVALLSQAPAHRRKSVMCDGRRVYQHLI